jgi:hypothetical protein
MEAGYGVALDELPRLKSLMADLLATESPDPAVLDEIVALAAAVAVQCREQARAALLGLVVEAARAMFPDADDDLRARLAGSSHADLSALGSLLDGANEARTAFTRADAGLMEARGRGDYGAMVPLALEAEAQKKALAAASAEFSNRTGFDGGTPPEVAVAQPSEEPAVEAATAAPALPTDPPPAALSGDMPDGAALPLPPSPAEPDPPGESPAGRRRIRDLIRQVRTMPDEALPAR